jgi:hypothetical protein
MVAIDQELRKKYLNKPSQHKKVNHILDNIHVKYRDQIEKRNLSLELKEQFRPGSEQTKEAMLRASKARSNFKKASEARVKSGSQSHRTRGHMVDGNDIPKVEAIMDKLYGDFDVQETLAESARQRAMQKSRV